MLVYRRVFHGDVSSSYHPKGPGFWWFLNSEWVAASVFRSLKGWEAHHSFIFITLFWVVVPFAPFFGLSNALKRNTYITLPETNSSKAPEICRKHSSSNQQFSGRQNPDDALENRHRFSGPQGSMGLAYWPTKTGYFWRGFHVGKYTVRPIFSSGGWPQGRRSDLRVSWSNLKKIITRVKPFLPGSDEGEIRNGWWIYDVLVAIQFIFFHLLTTGFGDDDIMIFWSNHILSNTESWNLTRFIYSICFGIENYLSLW